MKTKKKTINEIAMEYGTIHCLRQIYNSFLFTTGRFLFLFSSSFLLFIFVQSLKMIICYLKDFRYFYARSIQTCRKFNKKKMKIYVVFFLSNPIHVIPLDTHVSEILIRIIKTNSFTYLRECHEYYNPFVHHHPVDQIL